MVGLDPSMSPVPGSSAPAPARSQPSPLQTDVNQALGDKNLSREEYAALRRQYVGSGQVSESALRGVLHATAERLGLSRDVDPFLSSLAATTSRPAAGDLDALMEAASAPEAEVDRTLNEAVLESRMQAAAGPESFDQLIGELAGGVVSDAQRAVFQGLPDDQQRQFLQMAPQLSGDQIHSLIGPGQNGQPPLLTRFTPEQRETFFNLAAHLEPANQASLVNQGADLLQRDRDGVRMLDRLDQFVSQPRLPALGRQTPPITGESLLNQTVARLGDPHLIHQGNRQVCGAAILEYGLAQDNPGEFVRVAEALSQSGHVTVDGGLELNLPESSIPHDSRSNIGGTDHRVDLDRLLQSTFMDQTNLVRGEYDYPDNADGTGFMQLDLAASVLSGNAATGPGPFADLYGRMMGRSYSAVDAPLLSDDPAVGRRVQEALQSGEPRVPVVMTGFGSFHWLAVEGISYDAQGQPNEVTLRNPWQGGDPGPDEESPIPRRPLGGPGHKPGADGRVVMSYADFIDHLQSAVVPAGIAQNMPDEPF